MRRSEIVCFCLCALVAPLAGGCGSEVLSTEGPATPTPSPTPAPIKKFAVEGTFKNCAEGTAGPDGNVFGNGGGYGLDGALTLTRDDTRVIANYVIKDGLTNEDVTTSFDFASQGPASASLAYKGERSDEFAGLCVLGPGDEYSRAASLIADEGSLVYSAGTVFLSVTGTITGDLGACGVQSTPKTYWLVCNDGPKDLPTISTSEEAAADTLLAGTYACTSFISTYTRVGSGGDYGGSAGTGGKLTIEPSADAVTATYHGDSAVEATLNLTPVGASSAVALGGQSLSVSVDGTSTREPLPLKAATLTTTTMVSLYFEGSTAEGTAVVGNVACFKE
jgi:hypothetical protein